jgi:hypothetical protein
MEGKCKMQNDLEQYNQFHIHGDNIVECERVVDLIRESFKGEYLVNGPSGSPVCPEYSLESKKNKTQANFILFPGFGRWDKDILSEIKNLGGALREAADAVITGVGKKGETPLIAIEFCGALPAGNQAWQRSGRAFSFGSAGIKFLYVAELGGYELDANRVRKAARMPNPAVPFSYISYSLKNPTMTLPVFLTSPGADSKSRDDYSEAFANSELLRLIKSVILSIDDEISEEGLRRKALSFVETRAAGSRAGKTLTPKQWDDAHKALIKGNSLVDFLVEHARIKWSKTAYIDAITPTFKRVMSAAANKSIGLTSSELPMCVIPSDCRSEFAKDIIKIYGKLDPKFQNWLGRNKNLSVCWVMGFKPRGDDARPDRGLPPLARMLIGPDEDLLTVIYGPAPSAAWSMLHNDPRKLMQNNGLWESILVSSDALLADSSTDKVRHRGYLRSHWEQKTQRYEKNPFIVSPLPQRLGENDVDTALHLIFSHHMKENVFEGMCNPPGGDWSGVSLQDVARSMELRWLTLPRVSSIGAKRPDHVFQIFNSSGKPIILSVESKEKASDVEGEIGPRLVSYIHELLQTPASVYRKSRELQWNHSDTKLSPTNFIMASAAAFMVDTEEKIKAVISRSKVDLLLVFLFSPQGRSCTVKIYPNNKIGNEIKAAMMRADLSKTHIKIE